jgi:hypothetical protein
MVTTKITNTAERVDSFNGPPVRVGLQRRICATVIDWHPCSERGGHTQAMQIGITPPPPGRAAVTALDYHKNVLVFSLGWSGTVGPGLLKQLHGPSTVL